MSQHDEIPVELWIRVNQDVEAVTAEAGVVRVAVRDWRAIEFKIPDAATREALASLSDNGAKLQRILDSCPLGREIDIRFYLGRLERPRLLEWAITVGGDEVAMLEATGNGFRLDYGPLPEARFRLCRFALVRRDGDKAILESGDRTARMRLQGEAIPLLRDVLTDSADLKAHPLFELLWRGGFLEPLDAVEPAAKRCWEFHDRLFHQASRGFHETETLGGNYRFESEFPSPPARKPPMQGEIVSLPEPKVGDSQPLAKVMLRRKSGRDYSQTPIGLEALSSFLSRVARVSQVMDGDPQEVMTRPYPAAGSLHELEYYLAVGRAEDLIKGLYHYDSHGHHLVRLAASAGQWTR